MKKHVILIVMALTFVCYVNAQTTLFTTDFESYNVGTRLAVQAGSPWTTWSLAPGGAEDPMVSSTQAHSGTKSVYVVNNNDCVLQLFDKTTGRYIAEWYMFVETGKLGYFNLLSNFNGNNSNWAFQAYVYYDSIYVDAAGEHVAKHPFPMNTWNKIHLVIDLDDDFATFYLNDTEIVSYKWSKGALGNDNVLKLDGINFYGWNGTGSPVTGNSGYYIDDVKIDSVAFPEAPANLTATLNGNDIDVVWTAPSTPPDLYKLSRNGNVIYTTTGLTYTDVAPWPGTYTYVVRARYNNLGYSHSSNEDTESIAGGVDRELVLFEGGTYITCPYCPGAAMGLRDLIEVNQKKATAIMYHTTDDSYANPSSVGRLSYYNITATPTVIADGVLKAVGGSSTQSLYTTYLPMYNQRYAMPGHYTIDVTVQETTPDNFSAQITVTQTFAAYSSGMKLHAALTESNIPQAWMNQSELDYVCRAMYPSYNGTDLNFSSQNTQTINLNFSTTGYVKQNCQLVLFVQHHNSKEVFQTVKVDLSSVLGYEQISEKNIKIYPNPAQQYFIAFTSGKGILEIYDVSGKMLSSTQVVDAKQVIDIRGLHKGVYFVKYTGKDNSFIEKLVVE